MWRKSLFIISLVCFLFCGCSTKEQEPIETHQPQFPRSWSPMGKVYVCETTWENSPSVGHYWAFVLDFFSTDRVVRYETPNKDLTYHDDFLNTIDTLFYI